MGRTMNSWRKQRNACLISLVLAIALAACDGESEQKSDSAAPQDSITENQAITDQPAPEPEPEPEANSGTTSQGPDIVGGITGDEPTAGGESIPPDDSAEPAPEITQDAGAPPPQPVPTPPVVEAPPPPSHPPAKPPVAQARKEA